MLIHITGFHFCLRDTSMSPSILCLQSELESPKAWCMAPSLKFSLTIILGNFPMTLLFFECIFLRNILFFFQECNVFFHLNFLHLSSFSLFSLNVQFLFVLSLSLLLQAFPIYLVVLGNLFIFKREE